MKITAPYFVYCTENTPQLIGYVDHFGVFRRLTLWARLRYSWFGGDPAALSNALYGANYQVEASQLPPATSVNAFRSALDTLTEAVDAGRDVCVAVDYHGHTVIDPSLASRPAHFVNVEGGGRKLRAGQPALRALNAIMSQTHYRGIGDPQCGEVWRHQEHGTDYVVVCVSNMNTEKERFVPTVAYACGSGTLYSQPIAYFLSAMTRIA